MNHNMENFTPDGWFKTGDLVQKTPDGFLRIIGRTKEIINVGGEKVLPIEVESIIMEIDGIEDCVVFGIPNSITGQMVATEVVIKSKEFDVVEIKRNIKEYCASKLDKYKVPVKIYPVENLTVSERFKKIRLQRENP